MAHLGSRIAVGLVAVAAASLAAAEGSRVQLGLPAGTGNIRLPDRGLTYSRVMLRVALP